MGSYKKKKKKNNFCTDKKERKTYIKKILIIEIHVKGGIQINKIRREISNPGCAQSVLGRLCQL